MPFVFRCSEYGEILLVEPELKYAAGKNHGFFNNIIMKAVDGRCPRCGHKLQVPPVKVQVLTRKPEDLTDG